VMRIQVHKLKKGGGEVEEEKKGEISRGRHPVICMYKDKIVLRGREGLRKGQALRN